jgi:hypothetical protein
MQYLFTIPARQYYSDGENVDPSDVVVVIIDRDKEAAVVSWRNANDEPRLNPEWILEDYDVALHIILSNFGNVIE